MKAVDTLYRAFSAGYHAQWINPRDTCERGYWTFDPFLKPGDPEHAYDAWRNSPDADDIGFSSANGSVYEGTMDDWVARAQHAERLVDDLLAQNLELHEQLATTVDRLQLLEEFYEDHKE